MSYDNVLPNGNYVREDRYTYRNIDTDVKHSFRNDDDLLAFEVVNLKPVTKTAIRLSDFDEVPMYALMCGTIVFIEVPGTMYHVKVTREALNYWLRRIKSKIRFDL